MRRGSGTRWTSYRDRAGPGALMTRYGITADEAFAYLVRESQTHHVKLREIARRLAEVG